MPETTDQPDPKEAVEAQLCAYLEGELAPAERADLERHLAQNATHRQLLSDLAEARRWLRAAPREKAPPEVAEVYREQVERSILMGEDAPPVRPAARWPQYAMLAAMVAVVLGLGTLVAVMLWGPSHAPGGPVAMNSAAPRAAPPLATTRPQVDVDAMVVPPPASPVAAPGAIANGAIDGSAANNSGGFADALPANTAGKAAQSLADRPAPQQFAQSQNADGPGASQRAVVAGPRTVHLVVATADPAAVDGFIRQQLSPGRDAADKDTFGATSAAGGGGRRARQAFAARATAAAPAAPSTPAAAASIVPTTAPSNALADGRHYVAVGLTVDQAVQLAAGLKGAAGPGGDVTGPSPADRGRTIGSGQAVTVIVSRPTGGQGMPDVNVVRVSADGTVALPGIDPVPAAGATADELAQRVSAAYARIGPGVTATVVPSEAVPLATAGPAATQPAGDGATTVIIDVTPLPARR
jgi:hypothetical protein